MSRQSLNKLVVPFGKRTQINLSDGSKVWLNSGTILEFPNHFEGKERNIHLLSGEIYIEVSTYMKKQFIVHTNEFNVKVYGTKFNLTAYTDAPKSVVLVEGSVGLKSNTAEELILQPNYKAEIGDSGRFITKKVDVDNYTSWKNGYLVFDETPMSEVLRHLERYYNLSFNYDKDVTLKGLTCTGRIVLSENLDNVMTTIALITSTNYKRENNNMFISNKPQ